MMVKTIEPFLKGKRILAVDEDRRTAEDFKRIFERYGAEVDTAYDAQTAFDLLVKTDSRYDLMTLEIVLPSNPEDAEALESYNRDFRDYAQKKRALRDHGRRKSISELNEIDELDCRLAAIIAARNGCRDYRSGLGIIESWIDLLKPVDGSMFQLPTAVLIITTQDHALDVMEWFKNLSYHNIKMLGKPVWPDVIMAEIKGMLALG